MDKHIVWKVFLCLVLLFFAFTFISCGGLTGGNTDETDNSGETDDDDDDDPSITAWSVIVTQNSREYVITLFLDEENKTFTHHGSSSPVPRGTYEIDGTEITITFTVNPPPQGSVYTGTISNTAITFNGQSYIKQTANPFLETAAWEGKGAITENGLTLTYDAMSVICRADGTYEQLALLTKAEGNNLPGFPLPAIIRNTGIYSFLGNKACFAQIKTSRDGGLTWEDSAKDPSITEITGGAIPVSPGILLKPENDMQLNHTSWKATVTEEVNNVEETYDITLDFGGSAVNFSDNSSDPSSDDYDYSVAGNTVSITMGNKTTTGIITGDTTMNLHLMELSTFTKQP